MSYHRPGTHADEDTPDLSEIGGHWDERPVQYHGGDRTLVAPWRRIAVLPGIDWPHTPEDCDAGLTDTMWILDGKVLLCTGCGMDGT